MIDLHINISVWIFVVDVNVSISYAMAGLLALLIAVVLFPIVMRYVGG